MVPVNIGGDVVDRNAEQSDSPSLVDTHRMRRRGMMAAVAALAAGGLLKASEKSAFATQTFNDNVVISTPAGFTGLTVTTAGGQAIYSTAAAGYIGVTSNTSAAGSHCFLGISAGAGGNSGFGIYTDSALNIGGYFNGGATNIFGHGVVANARGTGFGVYAASAQNFAVYAASGASHGVVALGAGAGGYGVYASGDQQAGVYAISNSSHGVLATGGGANGFGVYAVSNNNVAVYAQANNAAANAGQFIGSVLITGNLVVMGTKSAAVPDASGGLQLVYCTESPDNWFEDHGRAQMVNGRATVPIRPDFVSISHTEQPYHVFLTPEGPNTGLYVQNMTAGSFDVVDDGDKTSISFTYRVVAKRKDVAATRSARMDRPQPPPPPGNPNVRPVPLPKADLPASR
jgi:hypothetical protein